MNAEDIAVVVPMFKQELNEYETISLTQCVKILGCYPLIAVLPGGLTPDYLTPQFHVEKFDPENFSSAQHFGRLQLSLDFYSRFEKYQYILTYHLDAFVFRDELLYWSQQGYDYIGAPWIGQTWPNGLAVRLPLPLRMIARWILFGDKDRRVGNGGFALRRIPAFLSLLSRFQGPALKWPHNEDGFWAIAAPSFCPSFNIPSVEIAARFAAELEPRQCVAMNNGEAPFGCHAWWTHDLEFWRPLFKECGYKI